MSTSTCRGLDVSAHQGNQDWTAHRRAGVAFALVKATEGQRAHDAAFSRHVQGALAAGILVGGYHFAWPNQDPLVEAANYIGAVAPVASLQHDFTHWLDLEAYPDSRNYRGRSNGQILAWVRQWIATVQSAFPAQRVGIYTSGSDLAAGHVPDGLPLWYPAYPWKTADYARAEAAPQPTVSGWRPLIWQFTSSPLDRSIAYLPESELRAWAAGQTTTIEEDPVPDEVNLGLAKPLSLAPGRWTEIAFTTEWTDTADQHPAASSVFARGACRFTGSVSLRIGDLPVGETVQVRMSEYTTGGTLAKDHPIDEAIGTKGDSFHVTPLTKHLAAGRTMRIRLLNNGADPVTVKSAVLTALLWKTS
ncbi:MULTISPECIES: glycoside hydrolase family 25 protein [Streptomyces]|uniref:Glycoside hydrolase family 25 protein n=1 Tax=Streptomyces doudnae TaxID=3075536 RepID=A0ABD5EMV1_9ACTN|nr:MULTISPECIES: glycoside hydrolase family 25 protein [unclassified Streptomyces]MDT0435597.1 glycoside hydrolase family 25 protein [Streptomyces sp. DSM 41981]MYQ62552.1 N-acetylmuramoyl-L-alanine amidase [Streptomyces sp. SID4950]SCD39827.1 Glycosyl hydrolases family 25 [Streptomyces sp. SolWspMP-5a-2]